MSATNQSNTGTIVGYINIGAEPIGQGFAPTASLLDSITYNLLPIVRDEYDPVDLAVNIRDTTITGSIIVTSSTVRVADGTSGAEGNQVFAFSPTVLFTGGHVYVAELVLVNGPGNAIKVAYTAYAYTNAHAIVNGAADDTKSLYFIHTAG